jgi:hypothetical protein
MAFGGNAVNESFSDTNSTKISKQRTKMKTAMESTSTLSPRKASKSPQKEPPTLSPRKASKSPQEKPKQVINGSNGALQSGSGSGKRKKADPHYVSPTPEEIIKKIEKDMKSLKVEVKKEFKVMESAGEDLKQAIKDAKAKNREDQLEKLKGNELIKIAHLHRLGFTNEVIIEHLKKENENMRKNEKIQEVEFQNDKANIQKMVQLNGESKKAVTAALFAGNQLRVSQERLKARLEQAEMGLYAEESLVEHKRGMRGAEIAKKSDFKKTLEAVVRLVMQRCKDKKLLAKVLKVAGKCLSHDAGLDDSSDSSSCSSSSSDEKEKLLEKVLKVAGKCLSHDAGVDDSSDSSSSSDEKEDKKKEDKTEEYKKEVKREDKKPVAKVPKVARECSSAPCSDWSSSSSSGSSSGSSSSDEQEEDKKEQEAKLDDNWTSSDSSSSSIDSEFKQFKRL